MSLSTYSAPAWLLLIASLLPASGCADTAALARAATTPTNTFAALWQPGWACGKTANVNRAFLRSLTDNNALHGYALNGIPLPILLGQNPEQSGAILFAKYNGKWQAYPIADGSVVLAAYSTPAFNRLMLFATGGREGPGNDYLVLYGKNQLRDFGCATAPFPAELSRPNWGNTYPGLHDFNMDTQGRGTLIAAANIVEGNTDSKHWYQYTSSDWGRSWSKALNLKALPPPKQGIFLPLQEVPASPWLLNNLLNSTP